MSKHSEENYENVETYVFLQHEGVYGTIVSYGAWASLINYFEDGISYTIEVPNDEFEIVDEMGIGYYGEEQEGVGYLEDEEEEEDYL